MKRWKSKVTTLTWLKADTAKTHPRSHPTPVLTIRSTAD